MASDVQNSDPAAAIMDLNDHYDDSDIDSDSGDDLEGIHKATTEVININTKYPPEWGGAEAFREFYQNFKDGIMSSFSIDERDFKPEVEEAGSQILICVFHPTQKDGTGSKMLSGFIRFRYDAKKLGVLEITNFKARLRRWHLGFEGTTKAKETNKLANTARE